ncbi:hypothetical protein, variant 1 [Aphanomyces invadans]|uniref:Uncharacterized protein n=1 Tax=Aphanomyces invadans TaxID=157072 RepID=A0A024TJL2_9STRA|nr:hypothetical protein, variant 1 [Aphanomyces invadans]ETV94184.1 hypothetical protein, variant 1 [Aphanomyces invadans]|eukprot:XP_008877386.1 hypothetical protein, variant 1 [Aphanomyces invadans]
MLRANGGPPALVYACNNGQRSRGSTATAEARTSKKSQRRETFGCANAGARNSRDHFKIDPPRSIQMPRHDNPPPHPQKTFDGILTSSQSVRVDLHKCAKATLAGVMGNAMGCCLGPEEHHADTTSGRKSPLLRRMHSFVDDSCSDSTASLSSSAKSSIFSPRPTSETPGSRLLRDFYQHVVDTDQSDSGGEEDTFHDAGVLPAAAPPQPRRRSLLLQHTETMRHLSKAAVDPLNMYSSLGLFHTNEPLLLNREDRVLRAKSVDSLLLSHHISTPHKLPHVHRVSSYDDTFARVRERMPCLIVLR